MTNAMCKPSRADCPANTGDSQDLAADRGVRSGSPRLSLRRGPAEGPEGDAEEAGPLRRTAAHAEGEGFRRRGRADSGRQASATRVGHLGEWHVDLAFFLNLGKLGSHPVSPL